MQLITRQVADIDAVHDELKSNGVREDLAPITLGDVARIPMILDPDGNCPAGPRSSVVCPERGTMLNPFGLDFARLSRDA